MKKFLAVYMGSVPSKEKSATSISMETRQQGMQAWGQWMQQNAASIVDQGGPLGKTKKASPQGVSDTVNQMTGYVIFQAESHQAAAAMFQNHPHFSIFPGDCVEIMECLDMPGM